VKINNFEEEVANVKLTVVQAEFPVVIRAFIPYLWTKPENVLGLDQILLGDNVAKGETAHWSLSLNEIDEHRMQQKITITPYKNLHDSGYKDEEFKTAEASTHYDRILSVPENQLNALHGYTFKPDPKISHGPKKPIENPPIYQLLDREEFITKIHIEGSAEDGAFPWYVPSALIPNIDWKLDFTLDVTTKKDPKIIMKGKHDGFPAYEIIMQDSTKEWKELYYWRPPVNRQAGPSTLASIGNPQEDCEAEKIIP
jgi:hypothetical protein